MFHSGEHFNTLAASQKQSTSQEKEPREGKLMPSSDQAAHIQPHTPAADRDQDHINQLVSDPEMQKILMDPDIQNLIQVLKEDPTKAQL